MAVAARWTYRVLFAAIAISVAGCSLTITAERDQCVSDGDCTALGHDGFVCAESLCIEPEVEETPFSCRMEQFAEPGPGSIEHTLVFLDLIGQQPAVDMRVLACSQFDAACDTPSATAITDSAGRVTVDLPVGFRGHLYVPVPESTPMLSERILNLYPPPAINYTDPDPTFVTSLAELGGLVMLAGSELVPGFGHLTFGAFDCDGARLQGVAVSSAIISESSKVIYIGDGGRPDLSLAATGASAQGAIVNLPPGFVTIRGTHVDEGKLFEQSVLIAPDTITTLRGILPSQTP